MDDKHQLERGCKDQIAQRLPQCRNASVVRRALKNNTNDILKSYFLANFFETSQLAIKKDQF